MIFWTYSLYIRNRLPYRESAGNALSENTKTIGYLGRTGWLALASWSSGSGQVFLGAIIFSLLDGLHSPFPTLRLFTVEMCEYALTHDNQNPFVFISVLTYNKSI